MVCDVVPRGQLDLLPLPAAHLTNARADDFIQELRHVHDTTSSRFYAANAGYKWHIDARRCLVEFDVGDFVWAILSKDRFPAH